VIQNEQAKVDMWNEILGQKIPKTEIRLN
jgi:hypothetical protein